MERQDAELAGGNPIIAERLVALQRLAEADGAQQVAPMQFRILAARLAVDDLLALCSKELLRRDGETGRSEFERRLMAS